jgi:hypothetical protein
MFDVFLLSLAFFCQVRSGTVADSNYEIALKNRKVTRPNELFSGGF